ncbi:MAG TPA: hypothetical protein VFC19_41235 [Candidatus Limnocylindrales bacterium]|nr:hypothetical protein [Candidatus Limnocylindrales bacterium]
MQDTNEQVRNIFATIDTRPPGLSTVDVARAIETGKRRKRFRRLGLSGAAVSLSVLAAIAIPYALQADHDRRKEATATASASAEPSAKASPTPTAKPGFQTRHYDRPGARALPTSCEGTKLPVPGGGIKSYVRNLDPSGRYVTGRIYGGDPEPVLWRDGKATRVPMGGNDDGLEAANTKGDAVGFSYPEGGPRSKAYVGGVLHELKGGTAEATGINDRGRISGHLVQDRIFKPVVWPSANADPIELAVPQGVWYARAFDIDEDGTVVGHIGDTGQRVAYVWYPDGTAQALPTPVFEGKPATDFDARRVRNGWVTGLVLLAQQRVAGVRWDLVTGKAEVLDQIEWSNDVGPSGWIVGMDRANDAVLTDGVTILKLPNVFAKPTGYGMNWGEAISDDGLTIAGLNDDKAHDGEQRGVVWKCR